MKTRLIMLVLAACLMASSAAGFANGSLGFADGYDAGLGDPVGFADGYD